MIHPPDPCTNPGSTHIFSHALVIYNGINSMNFIGLILSIDIHQHYLATGKSAGGTLTYLKHICLGALGPLFWDITTIRVHQSLFDLVSRLRKVSFVILATSILSARVRRRASCRNVRVIFLSCFVLYHC